MILVIGVGNELRRDDGFGPEAARRLKATYPELEILTPQQLLPELLDPICSADTVVFLDASTKLAPGELLVTRLDAAATATPLTHYSTPAAMIATAASLYDAHPNAWLITAGGADFELGEGLSEPVRKAVEQVVAEFKRIARPER